MNVGAVAEEMALALDTIDGLRVSAFVPGDVTPPAAIVGFADNVEFDLAYGRGGDRVNFPITVLVSRADDRTGGERISRYLDGSGTHSIKEALEAFSYTTLDSLRVADASVSIMTMGGVDYLAAQFNVEVIG